MQRPLYLDHNATTPLDPRVFAAMGPYFTEIFGNAASHSHFFGWEAAEHVEEARQSIATGLGASKKESIIFTSGATECNNMVIKGLALAAKDKIHLITQKTEHKCILDSCKFIGSQGHEITFLNVNGEGLVNPEDIKKSIKPNTVLCSIMAANNEIGTLQPIKNIAAICQEREILFHTDAAQAAGKMSLDVEKNGIDLLSMSAHKMYGPKGTGALYVSSKAFSKLKPLFHGGGHERNLRSGTLNVPGVIGLSKAFKISLEEMERESERLCGLKNHLWQKIKKEIPQAILNGHPTQRLANNLNISFPGLKAADILMKTPSLAISSGSACTSGNPESSYVLGAITDNKARIESGIRIGLGRWTSKEDVDKAALTLIETVKKLMHR
ncbi:MAG TPA: IscS subfamily cysteine desulfurase [Deltaproteobacteria bacterium]|nr:IscS subfamily cysteine desulfurase [Deltaproteobacteria bacterium]